MTAYQRALADFKAHVSMTTQLRTEKVRLTACQKDTEKARLTAAGDLAKAIVQEFTVMQLDALPLSQRQKDHVANDLRITLTVQLNWD